MLTIERRPPTAAELAVAFPKGSVKRRADAVAWCALPMLGLAGAGWVIQDIVRRAGGNAAPWPVVIGAALGSPVSIFLARAWLRSAREQRTRKLDVVEVLRVMGARFVEMEEHNDEGPHYFAEVDVGKLMFITGQWLYDPFVVGRDRAFPSTDFELARDPASGQVLSLRAAGAKAAILRTYRNDEIPLDADFPYAPAALFDGSLEQLPHAVDAASHPRKA